METIKTEIVVIGAGPGGLGVSLFYNHTLLDGTLLREELQKISAYL